MVVEVCTKGIACEFLGARCYLTLASLRDRIEPQVSYCTFWRSVLSDERRHGRLNVLSRGS